MNYQDIVNFLSSYSLPTIIIALIISIATILLKLILKDKFPLKLETYLPTLLAITLQFIYDCIFVFKGVCFSLDTLYAGAVASALATVITVAFFKLKNGERLNKSPLFMLIEGIVCGYVKKRSLEKVVNLISSFLLENSDEDTLIKNISLTLDEFKSQELPLFELEKIAKHVIISVKSLKE